MTVEGVSLSDGSEAGKPPPSLESANSREISSVLSPHYDASKDVVLRLEFLTATQMKARQGNRAFRLPCDCIRGR